MKKTLIVFLLFVVPASVYALDIPKYNVDKFCNQLSKAADGSAAVKNACFDLEQETYNKLKKEWKNIPENTKTHCDTIARGLGESYQAFNECVKLEAKEQKKKKEFKY